MTSYEQLVAARLKQEFEEFDNSSQQTGQAVLDRYWQAKLDEEAAYRRMIRELNPTGLRIWG
jgi:hypothetical protein